MPAVPSALLRVHRGLAAACGALFGASVFAFGFYDPSHWGPLALVVLAVCLALIASLRARPSVSALTAIAGLAGLWLWSLLSRGWSPSPSTALVDANRWALYAAMLAALVALVGADRLTARILVGACAAAVLAIAAYVLVRMLAGTAGSLFLGVRLNGPIGYVNAQADFLALGVWPLLAVAERTERPLRAGLALGTATTLGALVFVAQSRGSVLAFAASAIAIVALVPGRRARLLALALVLAGLYVASGRLAGVYRHPSPATGMVTVSALRSAALAALLAGAACGAAWAAAGLARRVLARVPLAGRDAGAVAASVLLAVLLAGGLAAVLARQASIRHDIGNQYDAFVHLGASPGGAQSRLFSGAGNRYDYWRIAWKEFESQPLRGVGAGGYDVGYYRDRRTNEDIRQPHSVELQTLAELGVVGGLALLAFVGGGLAGIWRCRGSDRLLAVAAGGTFCVWLAHSSVDWIELLPGLTGIGLSCVAALTASPAATDGAQQATQADEEATRAPEQATRPPGRGRRPTVAWVLRGAAAVAVAIAALFTVRMIFALHDESQAQSLVASNPLAAIARTSDALAFEDDDPQTYYVRAAALARLNLYGAARAALLRALAAEPDNWVTWGLLGDLATRHGDLALARRYYAQARRLDPRDAELGSLPAKPPAAANA